MAGQSLRQRAHATVNTLSNASTELTRRAYSLPQTYANYVASNSSAVSQIESTLRNLTYLVPGARFHDSELASESLHSFIQLLSIYHDHVLKNRSAILARSKNEPESSKTKQPKQRPSNHARYTGFWTDTSSPYTKVATLLKITQYTELLWEMMARRRGGERSRWRIVVLLESFKAICRLILLRLTKARPLVNSPMPYREDFAPPEKENADELTEEELKIVHNPDVFDAKDALGEVGVPTPPMSESEKIPISNTEPYSMPRTGLTLPTLPTPNEISDYLLRHVITADDVKPAKQLLHRLTSIQGQAAEVLYILRPAIYAILMQRVARQYGYEGQKWKKNWTPWLVGVTIEYFARAIARRDLVSGAHGGVRSALTSLEREEFTKRGWNMAWWGMRGAFYENITKKYIHGVADKLRGKPLLDLVGGVVEDYEFLWGNYYFSTATIVSKSERPGVFLLIPAAIAALSVIDLALQVMITSICVQHDLSKLSQASMFLPYLVIAFCAVAQALFVDQGLSGTKSSNRTTCPTLEIMPGFSNEPTEQVIQFFEVVHPTASVETDSTGEEHDTNEMRLTAFELLGRHGGTRCTPRADFMEDLAVRFETIKDQKIIVDELYSSYESALWASKQDLEDEKRWLFQQTCGPKLYARARRSIVRRENVLNDACQVTFHIRSWKSYLEDWIALMGILMDLWEDLFDRTEGDLFPVTTSNSAASADHGVCDNGEPTTALSQLFEDLKEIEMKMDFAQEGAHTHGSKVMDMINGELEKCGLYTFKDINRTIFGNLAIALSYFTFYNI